MTKSIDLQAADNIRALAIAMVEKSEFRAPRRTDGWCGFHAHFVFRIFEI